MRLCIRLKNRAKIKSNKKAALKDPNFDFFPFQGLNFRETNFKARQTFFLVTRQTLIVSLVLFSSFVYSLLYDRYDAQIGPYDVLRKVKFKYEKIKRNNSGIMNT